MQNDAQFFSKYGNFLNYKIIKKKSDLNSTINEATKSVKDVTDNAKKTIDDAIAKEIKGGAKGEDEELLTPETESKEIEEEIVDEAGKENKDETIEDIEKNYEEINPKEVFENKEDIDELINWLEEHKKTYLFDNSIYEIEEDMEDDKEKKTSYYIVYLDKKISENFPELENANIKVITVEEHNENLKLNLWIEKENKSEDLESLKEDIN